MHTYIHMQTPTDLFFSAVTFLSILQVTVAAALPSIHCPGVWQVEETLPSPRPQVVLQLLQVTAIKNTWKWMPARGKVDKYSTVVIFQSLLPVLSPFFFPVYWITVITSIVPSSRSHDTASILWFCLAAACDIMTHTEVVAHLMCHGGGNPDCWLWVILLNTTVSWHTKKIEINTSCPHNFDGCRLNTDKA